MSLKKQEKLVNLVKMNASAGSGKTHTLTNRFVNLLFQSDIAPCESCKSAKRTPQFNFSELLAITFTNLAANQMKEKVIAKLKQYALKELSLEEAHCSTQEELEEKAEQAHAMLERIFQQYGALNIRTIDSLLNQIIGLFALELGYSPHFETSFDSEKSIEELYTALAEQSIICEKNCDANTINYSPVFHELCQNKFENSEHASFMAKGVLQEQIAKFVAYCIKNNAVLSQEDLQKLEELYVFLGQRKEELFQEVLAAVQKIEICIEEQKITADKRFLNALAGIRDKKFSSAYLKKESFAGVLTSKNKSDITKASAYYAELQDSIKNINTAVSIHKNYALMLPVMKIAAAISVALDYYEKEKQCINTQKMPYMIASLLGENEENEGNEGNLQNTFLLQKKQKNQLIPATYCRLGTRLKHILYDEFQDTSVAQWSALNDLSGNALASGGSVFFVGDVKQAIYGWRGGKASLFSDAPAQLEPRAMGFADDNLPCNWRSSEYIVAWNNAFFQNLTDEQKNRDIALFFPASDEKPFSDDIIDQTRKSVQENYRQVWQDIDKKRLPKVKGKGIVEIHSLREADSSFDVAVLCLLPELVQNLYKKYNDYSKIAVLTVNNKQASLVSQILLEHNIPVVSQGSLGLKEHPVIIEVIAFLRFLANPLDENAFCQVLLSRHILPGSFAKECSVQTLCDFFVKKREGFLFTAFRDTYPKIWEKYFQVLVDGANLLTAYDTLCEVYKRMGIMELNPDAEVYLLRLKELAYLAEEKGIVDIQAFLNWWEENGEKENAPLPESLKSVSVLTMHKSKGLEYEAVIIPWHNFKIDVQKEICKFDVPFEGKKYPMYAVPKKDDGAFYEQAIAEKIKECINLLYVAWTRAKNELHVFLPMDYDTNNRKKDGTSYYFIKAFLERAKDNVKQLPFEINEDCFHVGEKNAPAVPETMLRALEYVFELCPVFSDEEKKSAEKYLSKEKQEKIALFFEEYRTEATSKKSKKKQADSDGEEDTAQKKTSSLKIPAEDVLYAAKWLSHMLISERKEKRTSSARALPEENSYAQEHLMDWLPQLRIFRSDLDELRGEKGLSSNKRGTIIHKSLEYLVFSGNIDEDCKRAGFEAMKYLPYGRFLEQSPQKIDTALQKVEQKVLYEEVQQALKWFAGLKEPFGGAELWFKYGYKEHAITNEKGELFRVDLLVEIPEKLRQQYQNVAYIAVDYKTGYAGAALPVPDNEKQILNYIDLLTKATGKKTVGVLVYLDNKKCCTIESK